MNTNKYLEEKTDSKGWIQKSYSITFNSALAVPLNPDEFNNSYKVTLNNGIGVSNNAKSCEVALVGANIWNFDANIKPPNNRLYYKPNVVDPQTFITIPAGYYGLNDLNSQIRLQLQLAGDDPTIFQFSGDSATQKVVVSFGIDGAYLDFNPIDSLKEILGFNARYSPVTAPVTPAAAGDIDIADNIAAFNSVNQFLIEIGSIVNDGININQLGTSIVGQVPIIAPPNSLIAYSPNIAIWVDCPHLIGANRTDIQFTLKNELLQDVTVLDDFSFTLTVRWYE